LLLVVEKKMAMEMAMVRFLEEMLEARRLPDAELGHGDGKERRRALPTAWAQLCFCFSTK
jgi:hypothetical protein